MQGILNVIKVCNQDKADQAKYAKTQLERGKSAPVQKMARQSVKNNPSFQQCVRDIARTMLALCKDSISTAVNLLRKPDYHAAGAAEGMSEAGAPESMLMDSDEEAGDARDVDPMRDGGVFRKKVLPPSLFDLEEWATVERSKDEKFHNDVNAFLDHNLKNLEPTTRALLKRTLSHRFQEARLQTKDDFSACLGNVASQIKRLERKKREPFFQTVEGQHMLPALQLLRTMLFDCTEAEMVMTYYLAGVCVGFQAKKQLEDAIQNRSGFQKQTRQAEVHDMAIQCIADKGSVQSLIETHVSNDLCDSICEQVAEIMKAKLQDTSFQKTSIVEALKHMQGMKSAADGNIFRGPWEPLWALLGMDTTACIGTHNMLLQAKVEALLMSALDAQQHIPHADVTLCCMCGYAGQCSPLVETSRSQFSPSYSKECGLILLCPPGNKGRMSDCVFKMMNFRRLLNYLSITLHDVMGNANTKYPPTTSLAAMLFCKPPEILSGKDHFHLVVERFFCWVLEVCRQCAHVRKYIEQRCSELQAECATLQSSTFSVEVYTDTAKGPQIEAQIRAKEAEIKALRQNFMIPVFRQGEVTVNNREIFEAFCEQVLGRMSTYNHSSEIPEDLVFFVRKVFVMLNGGTGGECTATVAEPYIRASGLFRYGEFSLDLGVWGGATWHDKTNTLYLRDEVMNRIQGLENYRASERVQTLMEQNSKLKLAEQVEALERQLAAMRLAAATSQATSLDANTTASLLESVQNGTITFDESGDSDAGSNGGSDGSIIEELLEEEHQNEREQSPTSDTDSRHDTVDSRQETVAGTVAGRNDGE